MTRVPAADLLRGRLQQHLSQRQAEKLMRSHVTRDGTTRPHQIVDGRPVISFCGNDYLGLASHPDVIQAWCDGAYRYGVGSGASHLVTGHCVAHQLLCEELAEFLCRDRVLLFSTGYMANMGVINALVSEGGLALQDQLNHASLLDGGWLSRGRSLRYPHADMAALLAMLQQPSAGMPLIVSDGVFSMDGDIAPLAEMAAITQQHKAIMMIDDAHGVGTVGPGGRGVVAAAGLGQAEVPVLVGTFGKAFGTAGAFVAGDDSLIDYLTQFARTYIYTTAMPPALAEATRASLRLLRSEQWRRDRLCQLAQRFCAEAAAIGLTVLPSSTPVQAVILGSADAALAASHALLEQGIQVSAIRPPTVPAGQARLRITFSALHSDADFGRLLAALAQVVAEGHGRADG